MLESVQSCIYSAVQYVIPAHVSPQHEVTLLVARRIFLKQIVNPK